MRAVQLDFLPVGVMWKNLDTQSVNQEEWDVVLVREIRWPC